MKQFLLLVLFFINVSVQAQTDYQKAWLALNKNSKQEATQLLEKAMQNPLTADDAYITSLYLRTCNAKESSITDFKNSFYLKSANPYPYIYALWFNGAVLGTYGKKTSSQIELASLLAKDPKAPGSITAAANYQLGMNELFSNNFEKSRTYYNTIGNIRNWQYTGPFENLSESGFDKDYGPLQHPEPGAVFRSLTNAEVKWVTPTVENWDGWTPTSYVINKPTSVVYAQNFVYSPVDQTVYCSTGFSGSIKVWVNDALLISEAQERITDFDAYTVKCDLKKGVNRVLIQLGFTNSSYPNFSLRFTDENSRVIPGITGSNTYAEYPKATGSKVAPLLNAQFSEKYFSDKIAADSSNLINYFLLTDAYLRSRKLMEARSTINKALEKAPDNLLVRYENVVVLSKEGNRTLLLEEIERIKEADPESLFVLDLDIKELFENQKYTDAEAGLEKRVKLYGEDETTYGYKIGILSNDKKYDEMIKLAEKMYEKYPDNANLQYMMYNIKKEVYKDQKSALNIYENYFKNNYNYDVWQQYDGILSKIGKQDKSLAMKEATIRNFPYSPEGYNGIAKYYYGIKQYGKAEEYINKAIALSSYNHEYWSTLGDILSEQKNVPKALDAYARSLQYDPNQYDILNKLRKIEGKQELYKLLKDVDVNQLIKEDKPELAKNKDYGYYYILDQKDVILYPGGASEEYVNLLIKITNQTGVDKYKESSIGYNNSQDLLIEKAQIIKKNGAKIDGEQNENEIVFTNLEPGDFVYFKYRLQSFVYGRFAKEFTDKHYFSGQIFSAVTRYNLLAPGDKKINFAFTQGDVKPVISNVENFKKYSWELTAPEPDKDEPLMPVLVDVGSILHISTLNSWDEISRWYSDIINNRSEEDQYVKDIYSKIFPTKNEQLSQFQKGKRIYNYIEKNIRYSSVSFRQSAYIPQKASLTLTTRLGDCKDLSNLFVTLSNMAGIKSQMVLVDTRDNGEKDLMLPSIGFNHCIVKAVLDDKNYYIELTDNELPFTSIPNTLLGALALEIPSKNGMPGSDIIRLQPVNKIKDAVKRTINIAPNGLDQQVSVKVIKTGSLTANTRGTYKELDNDKRLKEMEETVASMYKNTVKLQNVTFSGLDALGDSVSYSFAYKVNNEISEIGSMQTFKINYHDVVASVDKFTADTRSYPIDYWNYEDTDEYETVVNITAPTGKAFIELPASEDFAFHNLKYSLHFDLKSPGNLKITRKFSNDRPQQIAKDDYPQFKAFMEKIVKLEQKLVAYK